MREILFRGKDVTGKWRESGAVFVRGDIALMITERPIKEVVKDKNGELVDVIFNFCAVDKETVGQFTGLTDKNGKKIFDGDVVMFNGVKEYPMQIIWDDANTRFVFDDLTFTYSQDMEKHYADVCEVIGNIHDNPELLKGEKE